MKVYRGGSFSRRFPKWMRNGLRNRYRPDEWGAHLGMRCAMDLAGAACPDGSSAREDGKGCRVDGDPIPKPVLAVVGAGGGFAKVAASDPSAPPKETKEKVDPSTQPVTVSRDPTFDADCQRWKPGRPVSYMVRGGQFAERQAKKGACVNRDVGVGFNSVCCAQ